MVDGRALCRFEAIHICIVFSLVVKLFCMLPSISMYAPSAANGFVVARNTTTALLCYGLLAMFIFAITILGAPKIRWQRIGALIIHVVTLVLAYVDLTFARFNGSFVSPSQWSLWREGWQAVSTLQSFTEAGDCLFVVDLPVLCLLTVCMPPIPWRAISRRRVQQVALGATLFFIALSTWLAIRCPASDVLARPYNRRYTHPVIWLSSGIRCLLPVRHYPLPAPLSRCEPSVIDNERVQRRPRIVFVQVESLQAGVPEWNFGDVVVTPFMRRLSGACRYHQLAVSPRMSGNSFDADIGVLTGYQPPPTSDPYQYLFHGPPYFPHHLQQSGYKTITWDSYLPDFYRSRDNHQAMGMDTYHALNGRRWKTSLPRLSVDCPGDVEFLTAVATELRATQGSRFDFVRTLSSHGPWDELDLHEEVIRVIGRPFLGGPQTLRGYAATMRYVDTALAQFYQQLQPLIESEQLVLVIYGDHGAGLDIPMEPVSPLTMAEVRTRGVPLFILGLEVPTRHHARRLFSLCRLPQLIARHLGLSIDGPVPLSGSAALDDEQEDIVLLPSTAFVAGRRRALTRAEQNWLEHGYRILGAPM